MSKRSSSTRQAYTKLALKFDELLGRAESIGFGDIFGTSSPNAGAGTENRSLRIMHDPHHQDLDTQLDLFDRISTCSSTITNLAVKTGLSPNIVTIIEASNEYNL
jgi:hypothetical protein